MDFTDLQITFLRYVNIYSSVLTDISLGDVGEIVLECDLYTDAYLMYRNHKDKKEIQNTKGEPTSNKKSVPSSAWVFKQPTKKEK
jgi:hypothetical protein